MTSRDSNKKESNSVDTSETDVISGTESYASENLRDTINPNLSLNDLFAELNKETNDNHKDNTSNERREFEQIQKTINKLPKISTKLDDQPGPKKTGVEITKVNDPIPVKKTTSSKEKEDTAGSKWFNMRQPELTPDVKKDIFVVKHRNAIDPKRHYKKEKWDTPKYFHIGTIIEGNAEYHTRMKKKERGQTLVDEILNDSDSKKFFRRKYSEIQERKESGGKKYYKNVKNMRKRF
ncbi:Piso0_002868 [Millerozyma farinosa CBS 7064]|uniref:Piso0_002868 protein n=1 Tax=Pichia sorbitophila (strain ATCC MYA-4447 / BCRC 22081 / CBS 7064 / NBRC 10061 / NRRL Y-12695) TaxID=559304 RepID=G8YG70_PICSO|nr:Piso0_002868 [Millerozyma farinosa CBS 7064]